MQPSTGSSSPILCNYRRTIPISVNASLRHISIVLRRKRGSGALVILPGPTRLTNVSMKGWYPSTHRCTSLFLGCGGFRILQNAPGLASRVTTAANLLRLNWVSVEFIDFVHKVARGATNDPLAAQDGNNLSGSFPVAIVYWSHLQSISASLNSLKGSL